MDMGLFDIFGKKDEGDSDVRSPFSLRTSLSPVRMTAHKSTPVDLHVSIKNRLGDAALTSIMIQVPKGLGLDQTGITRAKEIRLGYLNKGEEKEIIVPVWGHVMTEAGDYKIVIEIYCHYRTYAYIQNSVKKAVELRVV